MNLAKINLQLIIIALHIFQAATFTTTSSSKILAASNKSQHSLSGCFDNPGSYYYGSIKCSNSGPLLQYFHCATYNENTKILSFVRCPYFQQGVYNITTTGYVQLPRNLSQLNDYMCDPLNRKGLVCSECADGFGPSVTSFGYRCVSCSDAWYGVPLYLILNFAPITLLYLVILVFQISITSAPMPCFVMYAQVVATVIDSDISKRITEIIITDNWDVRLDMQIILTLYGIFNLDFYRFNVPLQKYCVSSKLKYIHMAIFGYIFAFYPVLLIFLTWLCVELHGRNFRLLVWLWRPFHRCFVRLRRGWDTKSDIIDAFATFFILSYSKIMYQTTLLLAYHVTTHIRQFGGYYHTCQPLVDQSINYGSSNHLSFAIPALIIFLVFNVLPPLMLICYPIKVFRSCLSKCHLNFVFMHTFIDKVHCCYRNGLDGGRDMRSFSGLYFFPRYSAYLPILISPLINTQSHSKVYIDKWIFLGTFFCIISLSMTYIRPHKKAYMNYMDALLLLNMALLCFVLFQRIPMLVIARMLLSLPIVILSLVICLKKIHAAIKQIVKIHSLPSKLKHLCKCFGKNLPANKLNGPGINGEEQPLIKPTSTIISYGADINKATE